MFFVLESLIVIIFIVFFCCYKHYTINFAIVSLIFINLCINLIGICSINELMFKIILAITSIATISLLSAFLYKKYSAKDENNKSIQYLDFSRKVLSFSRLRKVFFKPNLKQGRIIGSVLPYNRYQLKYNGRYLQQSEISAAGATMISGSIGSGKTYGMKSLIKQNIVNNKSVIFAEYKGDKDLVKELSDFAKKYDYQIFKIEQGTADFNYDPLQNINNVGRIEAIINMRKWSIDGADAHYRTSTQLLLQKLVGDFAHIYDKEKHGPFTFEFFNYVKKYHPGRDEWDSYNTVNKLLELIITSNLQPMFEGKNDKTLDFSKLKNKKFLVIVSFTSSNKELATSFSSLMFKDLLDECTVSIPNENLYLYIDEFATLENPFIIKDILEKGRSGKLATTLALQDINQIIIQTNEAYLNSILGIINTFIVYSGATRITAEKFAGVQLSDIEHVLMNLRKPINGKKPTAIYISKYPTLNKRITSEVFRFEPYIYKEAEKIESLNNIKYNNNSQQKNIDKCVEDIKIINNDDDQNIPVKNNSDVNDYEEKPINYEDFI